MIISQRLFHAECIISSSSGSQGFPEPEGAETEEFARMLAEQPFWAESQDHESGGQIGLAFTQGEDDEEPLLLVYMRDDGGHEAPAKVAEEMASGEREYTWLRARFYWD